MTEEETPRKKVNYYILNSIPRPICNVEFQYQPFYKTVYKMLQPVAVYCVPNNKPSISKLEKILEHTIFEYEFHLPDFILTMINEQNKNVQLQIRFGKEVPGMSELSEGLPDQIEISINSFKGTTKDSPINFKCAHFLLLNGDENKISIIWPHCKTPYYMMVNIVESLTIEDLVKHVQFNNKLRSITLNTKAKAMEFLKKSTNDSDIELIDSQTLQLSLLCPITKIKMKLPTRSLKCSHLQCFDLRSFFALNNIKPTWKCPICYIPILVDQLVVDSFILDIINSSSLPKICFQIMVFKNGNWEPHIELKKKNLDDQSKSEIEHSKNTSLTVDLGNYNDENPRDEKNILPKTN